MRTDEALRIEKASVAFDGFKAIDIDRFAVRKNEMRIVIGPNGAGKTTLCDVISGKTRLDTGRVFLDGEDVTALRDFELARRGVGRKFQTPSVFGSLTVAENLELASSRSPWRTGRFGSAGESGSPRPSLRAVAELVGLLTSVDVQADDLSHGQRQALEIAMLVVADSQLLLLDEPAAGLSDEETTVMAALLRQLAGARTLIVIEHDMDFVRALASPITVMNEGKILAEGPMSAIESDPRVVEAYLGR